MDIERRLFNRFTAEDQGMLESPHNTPAKQVRFGRNIEILLDSFARFPFRLLLLKIDDLSFYLMNC